MMIHSVWYNMTQYDIIQYNINQLSIYYTISLPWCLVHLRNQERCFLHLQSPIQRVCGIALSLLRSENGDHDISAELPCRASRLWHSFPLCLGGLGDEDFFRKDDYACSMGPLGKYTIILYNLQIWAHIIIQNTVMHACSQIKPFYNTHSCKWYCVWLTVCHCVCLWFWQWFRSVVPFPICCIVDHHSCGVRSSTFPHLQGCWKQSRLRCFYRNYCGVKLAPSN